MRSSAGSVATAAAALLFSAAPPSYSSAAVPPDAPTLYGHTITRSPFLALAPACTEGLFPEFDGNLDVSDCLQLPRRVVWRGGARAPLIIRQTWDTQRMGTQSTGSAVWTGGIAISRYMEARGPDYWAGKRVVELGCGTGLASITAAKLGATVVATDRDPEVLTLASANARDNLSGRALAAFSTAKLAWGKTGLPAELRDASVDLVVGADITYNRDAWPVLFQTVRQLNAPALVSATERRPGELATLRAFLSEVRLRYTVVDSPLPRGYGAEKVKLFFIERPMPGEDVCDFWTEETFSAESTLVVRCPKPKG
jgi:predicted nicotinamide N-methyase